jgi:NADH-quinone oxidoreductase subunit M
VGLPTTSGFVGEFLVLVGAFGSQPWFALPAALGVILAAYYMLPMVQKVAFNALDRRANRDIPDLNGRELAVLLPLAALILWIGVYPKPFLERMEPAAARVIQMAQDDTRLAPDPAQTIPDVAASSGARR